MQKVNAAYAKTKAADILTTSTGSGGHTIMIIGKKIVYNPDGSIDGERSYMQTLEQTPGPISAESAQYDPQLGRTVYTCFVEKNTTFASAFSSGYLPKNCLELVDASAPIDTPKITDTLAPENYSYANLFSGVLHTNRMISNVTMTITDSAGVQTSVTGFGIRTSTDQTFSIDNYYMQNLLTEDPAVLRGGIDPTALSVGDYHCTVEALLSTGDRFIVREFDFFVTQEDIENPPKFPNRAEQA